MRDLKEQYVRADRGHEEVRPLVHALTCLLEQLAGPTAAV